MYGKKTRRCVPYRESVMKYFVQICPHFGLPPYSTLAKDLEPQATNQDPLPLPIHNNYHPASNIYHHPL